MSLDNIMQLSGDSMGRDSNIDATSGVLHRGLKDKVASSGDILIGETYHPEH